jgi:flagellin
MQAVNANRMLSVNNNNKSSTLEKLSSGLRINKAGDDAAGLAISEKMKSQIRGLRMASRNSQDAISLIQTAEGATAEVHAVLQRMRELTVQSLNDTNVDIDRDALQVEVRQLTLEVDRIANTTEFNGINLLNGTGSGPAIDQSTLDGLTASIPAYLDDAMDQIEANFAIDTPAGVRDMAVTYYSDDTSSTGASMGTSDGGASLELRVNLASITDTNGNLLAEPILDTLLAHEMMHAYQFTNMSFATDGATRDKENWFLEGLAMSIQGGNFFGATDSNVSLTNPFDGDYRSAYEAVKTLHEITDGGIDAIINSLESGNDLDAALTATTQAIAGTELAASTTGFVNFTTVDDFINWFNADADGEIATYIATSNDFTQGSGVITNGSVKGSNSNVTFDATIANDAASTKATDNFNISFTNPNFAGTGGYLTMQIGANESQTMTVQLGNVTATNLGIQSLNISTRTGGQAALESVDAALQSVSNIRSRLGALQNRLEHTIKNLDNSQENLQSAESRIRDADMANTMMKYSKENILSQAAQSMLAQANSAPRGVLQLIS